MKAEETKEKQEEASQPPSEGDAKEDPILDPHAVTEEEVDRILDGTMETPSTQRQEREDLPPHHPLINMTYDGLRRLDGDMRRSDQDGPRRPGPYDRPRHVPEEEMANYVRAKEFVCFLAKTTNKKPAVGGKVYRRETLEMQKKLNVTRAKEWSSWKKYKAVSILPKEEAKTYMDEGHKPIPLVWLDLDKNEKIRTEDNEVEEKLKSRMVMRGDMEEGSFRVDCPTASSVAIHLVVSLAASRGTTLKSGDITAAFLQGVPIQRIVLLRAPADGIPGPEGEGLEVEPGSYMKAEMSIYGSKDAPRGFWLALRNEITGQPEVHEVAGEPALYSVTSQGQLCGYIATHVDDVIWPGDHVVDEVMSRVQQRFTFGATDEGSFRYCGRIITDTEKYIEITSPETLEKVKPIFIERQRERKAWENASREELSQMRGVLGSIGWIARLCRPELCYKTSALQGKQSMPSVGDLLEVNKLLSAAQKTKDNGVRFYKHVIDFDNAVILSVTDASHAAELHINAQGKEKGYGSQGGRFVFLANSLPSASNAIYVHPIEWSSSSLKRVCRSTLQAETLSSMIGSESAQHLRTVLYGSLHEKPPGRDHDWQIQSMDSRYVYWLTDCRSLVDFMGTLSGNSVSDKRLAIDLTTLRPELWRPAGRLTGDPAAQPGMPQDARDQMYWVSTRDMVADGLTKSMRWGSMRRVLEFGTWQLTEGARRVLPGFLDDKSQAEHE